MNSNILVLLSTYKGAKFLDEQLSSIFEQEEVDVSVLIREDGSKEDIKHIINKYMLKGFDIELYEGENIGPAYSFLNLISCAYGKEKKYDYYAFSDQDDVWKKEKLSVAVKKLNLINEKYLLYTSSLEMVDVNLNIIGEIDSEPYLFPEYMVRNQCAGCSMVFNYNTLELVNSYKPKYVEMHDVWILRLLSSIKEGYVYYDKNSYILYRQHNANVVGGKHDINYIISLKFKQLFGKEKKVYWTVKELLNGYGNMIDSRSIEFFDKVIQSDKSFLGKVKLLKYIGDYKFSTKMRKVFFIINVLFNNL